MATDVGLVTFDPASRQLQTVQPMEFGPGFRTNDGKIDPAGRFWWSTMDDNDGERPGAIHRTGPGSATARVIEGVHIANAMAFSADGQSLYLADSKLQTIFVHDTADLSNRQVFARTDGEAAPDGAAIDAEGYLWNAEWGGWRIVRYAPDGAIDRVVETPVAQPTSCAFGGPELGTLYVTSAWDGLSDAARAMQPEAGGLFALEPGVRGLALPAFQG
jgi:sugar lactone lactonase YvrE